MKTDNLQRGKTVFSKENMDYHVALLCTSFGIRIFDFILGLICIYIIRHVVGVNVPWTVSFIFYVWLFTSVIYLAVFKMGLCKTRKQLDNVHCSYYFFGVSFATMAQRAECQVGRSCIVHLASSGQRAASMNMRRARSLPLVSPAATQNGGGSGCFNRTSPIFSISSGRVRSISANAMAAVVMCEGWSQA